MKSRNLLREIMEEFFLWKPHDIKKYFRFIINQSYFRGVLLMRSVLEKIL